MFNRSCSEMLVQFMATDTNAEQHHSRTHS